MAYKLIDTNGQEVTHHDLQDKGAWCIAGASKEEIFIQNYGGQLNLIINPEKSTNPMVPDLFNSSSMLLGDLKVQSTPFFQAETRFGINPQYAVVFNYKDVLRYSEHYPNIEIYFWVDWQAVAFESGNTRIEVEPMNGVWFIPFQILTEVITTAPLHSYQQRVFDRKGNAKASYVLNLENSQFNRII